MYGDATFSNALFNCALECALHRKNRSCRNNFRDAICGECKWYIGRYIDTAPEELELFMLEAEFHAGAIKATSGGHHIVFAIMIGLCLLFAFSGYRSERRMNETLFVPQNTAQRANSSTHDLIMTTLRKVSYDLSRKTDVNSDKLVNCIDSAVLFYKHYPNKKDVCIMVNRNPKTGMHHLFNCVMIDGVWRAIEPQAVHTNNSSYFMRDVWGTKYDHTLNRDSTEEYIKYVR